ncbi:hypothetical protein [Taylorella equigenitalis]|uniref:hypothetical protein n=1 Tax=Taylorella equigenitalis TaxID=29575 RepID=UPI00041D788C|nr:hypothetical protein [Taylorella equigenitalis]ASY37213.1 hypothetical protein CA605_00550 [Taylorella equigenitalis]ASY41638.1 hypothetical protein CA943_00550 [Taylorella equigenitalis]KGK33439.1 hypothetical protein LW90_03635 [Taylorella equigenitalis]RBA27145.1 hypothetical protein DQW13_01515 [Taylorella equigenitalis]
MSRKNYVYWYLVEGETEKHLVDSLIKNDNLQSGRINILSCWFNKNKISTQTRRFSRSQDNIVYLIFDTDDLTNLDYFESNCNLIIREASKVYLLGQANNLEDELLKSCSLLKNKNDLYKLFSSQGSKEFKSNFIKDQNLLKKLERKGFDNKSIWISNNLLPEKLLSFLKKFKDNSKVSLSPKDIWFK